MPTAGTSRGSGTWTSRCSPTPASRARPRVPPRGLRYPRPQSGHHGRPRGHPAGRDPLRLADLHGDAQDPQDFERAGLHTPFLGGQMKLVIHHLYADMMNLYGDRGNVISIKKRCEWRGIPVEVVDVGLGERVKPTGCDIFLFGGGQDREQALLAEDLSGSKGADLRAIVEDGGVVLGVCGGYQLMGH